MVKVTNVAICSTGGFGAERVNQYVLGFEVGRGTYCQVRRAHNEVGDAFAVKSFVRGVLQREHVAHFDEDGATTVPLADKIAKELHILQGLHHPGIVRLEEIVDDPSQDRFFAVFEELCGGQLMEWQEQRRFCAYSIRAAAPQEPWESFVCPSVPVLGEKEAIVYQEILVQIYFKQMMEALVYLHTQCIAHRDLKPDNLLVTLAAPPGDTRFTRCLDLASWPTLILRASGAAPVQRVGALLDHVQLRLKLADFNCATVFKLDTGHKIYSGCGTPQFSPPECLDGREPGVDGVQVDAWASGCVLFNMLFARCPFWAEQNVMVQLAILTEDLVIPDGVLSTAANAFLRRLLEKDPDVRLTPSAALQDPWLAG